MASAMDGEAVSWEGRAGHTCTRDSRDWGGSWIGGRDETEKTRLWLWLQGRKDVGTRLGCMWLGHDAYLG